MFGEQGGALVVVVSAFEKSVSDFFLRNTIIMDKLLEFLLSKRRWCQVGKCGNENSKIKLA